MFDNIGGKIKTLAKVLCWIGIIASLVFAIVLWSQNNQYDYVTRARTNTIGTGLIVLVIGCLGSWMGSFFMYGFGELIEETTRNRQFNEEMYKMMYEQHHPDEEPTGAARAAAIGSHSIEGGKPEKARKCSKCLGYNSSAVVVCKFCGTSKE